MMSQLLLAIFFVSSCTSLLILRLKIKQTNIISTGTCTNNGLVLSLILMQHFLHNNVYKKLIIITEKF